MSVYVGGSGHGARLKFLLFSPEKDLPTHKNLKFCSLVRGIPTLEGGIGTRKRAKSSPNFSHPPQKNIFSNTGWNRTKFLKKKNILKISPPPENPHFFKSVHLGLTPPRVEKFHFLFFFEGFPYNITVFYLNFQFWRDCNASWFCHICQCFDTILNPQSLIRCKPRTLGHPEYSAE